MQAPVTPLRVRFKPKTAPPLSVANAAIQEAVQQAVVAVAAGSAPVASAPARPARWSERVTPEQRQRNIDQARARRARLRQQQADRAAAKEQARREAAKADARAQAKASRARAEARTAELRARAEADANAARRAAAEQAEADRIATIARLRREAAERRARVEAMQQREAESRLAVKRATEARKAAERARALAREEDARRAAATARRNAEIAARLRAERLAQEARQAAREAAARANAAPVVSSPAAAPGAPQGATISRYVLDAERRGIASSLATQSPMNTRIGQAFRRWTGPIDESYTVTDDAWSAFLRSREFATAQREVLAANPGLATAAPRSASGMRSVIRSEEERRRARERYARLQERRRAAAASGQPVPRASRMTATTPPPARRRASSPFNLKAEPPDPKDYISRFGSVQDGLGQGLARQKFEELFGRGATVEDAFRNLAVPVPNGSLWNVRATPSYHGNGFSISGQADGARITRSFTWDANGHITVDHDYFQIRDDLQKSNFSKRQLHKQFRFYAENGINTVKVHANIDVGGYAWARAGFTPSAGSVSELRDWVGMRLSRLRASGSITDQQASVIEHLRSRMEKGDKLAVWDTADLEDVVTYNGKTMKLGQHLLVNSNWYGSVNMKSAEAAERIMKYYGVI
jgi:hypothetical protein